MYLKLPSTYVDPATQAPLPDAILVVADADFRMRSISTVLQCAVYASIEAYLSGGHPVSQFPKALSPAEIAAQQPALLGACYQVLAARAEYSGTQVVP